MIDLKQCSLGIELGSTRIKAVLVGDTCKPVAQGDFTWENRLENGIWTYPLEEVWQGVQAAYAALAADVLAKCGQPLTTVGCIGVSAMMHGYLAFDAAGKLLVPQHDDRRGGRRVDLGVRVQHPAAVERSTPVPSHAEPRATPAAAGLFHHAGRLCTLAADRAQGAGRRRCQRHVPDRQHHRRV